MRVYPRALGIGLLSLRFLTSSKVRLYISRLPLRAYPSVAASA